MNPRHPGMHIVIDSKLLILRFLCADMRGFRNRACLSVPREKKSPYFRQYQSYISN